MHLFIVTGMSGAGKSTVLKFLEDMGFYCADNIPPSLIASLATEVCGNYDQEDRGHVLKLAIGIDIRGGRLFEGFFEGLSQIAEAGFGVKVLFMDASDDALLKRFKETRRRHPLAMYDCVNIGITLEREKLKTVRARADYVLDTSRILLRDLKPKIREIFLEEKDFDSLIISVVSFGFKYGVPTDSDLVFDVRFIPNPFYDENLRHLTGLDTPVSEFVMSRQETQIFLDKFTSMLDFLIPCYKNEGKNQLVIAIGCTGGKHRSVAIGQFICNDLHHKGNSAIINHRDIEKDKPDR